MKYCIITFRSVTPAQRGEETLRRAGVSCSLRRTPKWMEEQGCGYSVRVRYQDAPMAVSILREKQIPMRKVYLFRESGAAEELAL